MPCRRPLGLFTGDSAPAAYDNADTLKSVVIVSGGANDTAFCKGVISSDSTSPHSTREPKINCKAQNGDPNAQAVKLCTAMKKNGITIYTVSVGSDSTGASTLSQCASGTEQIYTIESDDQLEDMLVAIAVKLRDGSDYDDGTISSRRLTERSRRCQRLWLHRHRFRKYRPENVF